MAPRLKRSNEIITTEKDFDEIINLLRHRTHLRISEKQRKELEESQGRTFEKVFAAWNYGHHDYSEDEEERVKDFDQNHRLEMLWTKRKPWVNYLLSISFHFIVLINFFYCLWESFGILVENAKFDHLYIKDAYQCLNVVPTHDDVSHTVSIFHAMTCVAVFHAKTLQTANLCWAFLAGTVIHACFKVYEVLYDQRFTFATAIRGYPHWRNIQLCVVLLIQILAILVILQRYYDLTALFQKRSHKFVTQTYEGRALNDRIIYRNVSSFVQRKFVLRSCTALQIYNAVQRIQLYKKKLKRGEELDMKLHQKEVDDAIKALQEVEGFKGMEMMRELKRRNYEKSENAGATTDKKDGKVDTEEKQKKKDDITMEESQESDMDMSASTAVPSSTNTEATEAN